MNENSSAVRTCHTTRFMRSRPLALCAICYCAGAAAGALTGVSALVWGALLLACAVAFALRKRAIYLFMALAFIASWTNAAMLQRRDISPSDLARVRGTVCAVNDVNDIRSVVTLKDVALDGKRAHTKLRAYIYEGDATFTMGDIVEFDARTWIADGASSPGGFDFRKYLARKGVWLCGTAKSQVQTLGRRESAATFFDSLRKSIASRIDEVFGPDATLAKAILLSDKTDMPDEQRESFQKAGVAHLLAVSGLHISCLALAIGWLLRKIGFNRYASFFITAPVIAAYVVIIGMPASAVRALVMYCMVESARVFGRKYDSLTAIGLAFMILIAPNPLDVMDTGLILSFTAVLGIVIFNPLLTEALHVKRYKGVRKLILSAVCVSLAAQIGTTPAVSTFFGTFNTYSILTNIALVPICTFALPVIAASVAIAAVFPALAAFAAALPKQILSGMNLLANGVSSLPYSTVYVPAWPLWSVAAFIAMCAVMSPYSALRQSFKRRMLLAPVALTLVCVVVVKLSLPMGLCVTFADAGNADSSIVRSEGKTYFIDLGNEGCSSVDYLCYTGQGVDGVFLTHPHSDHCGGLKTLMAVRDIPTIYIPEGWYEHDDSGVLDICDGRGTEIIELSAGDEVALSENVVCEVLSPETGAVYSKTNDLSLVLRLSYGNGSALMMGDVSSKYEPDALCPSQLLKAAHHGSADGTSARLLTAVNPSVVVITSGRSFDELSKKFLGRLKEANVEIYHTGENGMVTAKINNDGTLDVESFL